MRFDVIIRNGMVVRDRGVEKRDIAIADEKIVELAPEIPGDARETIDASGLHVFPGLIDPHVHFNEPGRTEWEGISTGSAALAAGGGTLFFDMPLNSSPPVLDAASFDLKLAAMRERSLTDFALWGGLTPNNLDHLEELAERGVVGFKAFMCDSGMEDFPRADTDTLLEGMAKSAKLGLPVAVHAEDPLSLKRAGAPITGRTWRDYLASRPLACEGFATRLAIQCAKETGCSLHIVHVSSYFVVSIIEFERQNGVKVTCETCPHYFLLSEEDLPVIGARAKCAPPLREREYCGMLLAQLANGEIDFIASDHSPAPPSMKTDDDAFASWGGIAGIQTTLVSLLTCWMNRSDPLRSLAPVIAGRAAKRFNLVGKGQVAVRSDADFALVDTNERHTLTADMLLDRHKLSPYVGRTFRGRVIRTLVRGHTVLHDGKIVSKPIGRFVRPAS